VGGVLRSNVETRAARVRLQAADDPYGLDLASVAANKDGTFLFQNVAPGRYLVSVLEYPDGSSKSGTQSPSAYRFSSSAVAAITGPTVWASVAVTAVDAGVSGLEIPLRKGAAMTGRLTTDGPGEQVSLGEWAISINPVGAWRLGQLPLTRVRADGSFRTVGLPPGLYLLGAFPLKGPRGTAVWHVDRVVDRGVLRTDGLLTIGDDDTDGIEIVLSSGGEVSGIVTSATGRSSPGVKVYLFAADRRYWGVPGAPRMFEATSEADGHYVFRGVPSGGYRIVAVEQTVPGWRQRKRLEELDAKGHGVSVASGGTTRLNLRVASGK